MNEIRGFGMTEYRIDENGCEHAVMWWDSGKVIKFLKDNVFCYTRPDASKGEKVCIEGKRLIDELCKEMGVETC